MSEKPVTQETWTFDEEYRPAAAHVTDSDEYFGPGVRGTPLSFVNNRSEDEDDHPVQQRILARCRLALAAPELYRALKAVEWGTIGEPDFRDGECPACGGRCAPFGHEPVSGMSGHEPGCIIAAALAKAEGRTP